MIPLLFTFSIFAVYAVTVLVAILVVRKYNKLEPREQQRISPNDYHMMFIPIVNLLTILVASAYIVRYTLFPNFDYDELCDKFEKFISGK